MAFDRRTYRNPAALAKDLARVLAKSGQVVRLMRGQSIDPAFRERLMLTVTAVNQCRYCTYEHARQALVAGVRFEEVEALSNGILDECPPAELPALLYARHWAETDGDPDLEARRHLLQLYGDETAQAVELALTVIRMGNLGGNTLDHILYRISFGRLGSTPGATRHSPPTARRERPTVAQASRPEPIPQRRS